MVGSLLEHPDGRRALVQAVALREQWWALVDEGTGRLESWAVSECRLLGPEMVAHVPTTPAGRRRGKGGRGGA